MTIKSQVIKLNLSPWNVILLSLFIIIFHLSIWGFISLIYLFGVAVIIWGVNCDVRAEQQHLKAASGTIKDPARSFRAFRCHGAEFVSCPQLASSEKLCFKTESWFETKVKLHKDKDRLAYNVCEYRGEEAFMFSSAVTLGARGERRFAVGPEWTGEEQVSEEKPQV